MSCYHQSLQPVRIRYEIYHILAVRTPSHLLALRKKLCYLNLKTSVVTVCPVFPPNVNFGAGISWSKSNSETKQISKIKNFPWGQKTKKTF